MAVKYATDETYNELVGEGVVLADFFGKTCFPCKMLSRVLEELENEIPSVNIVKADVEECPETARRFGISAIPDLYYYKDGKLLFHETGAVDLDYIKEKLGRIL